MQTKAESTTAVGFRFYGDRDVLIPVLQQRRETNRALCVCGRNRSPIEKVQVTFHSVTPPWATSGSVGLFPRPFQGLAECC